MSAIVKLSPELRTWIDHNLNRGCAPAQLVQSMVEQRFEPRVAAGVIDAFVAARKTGAPLAGDSLTLEAPGDPYESEPPRMASGNVIRADDRAVPVLLRLARPAIAVLGEVLSAEECDQLVALARPRLAPSTVVDPKTGLDRVAEHRSSEGMFFLPRETPLIAALDRRLAQLMGSPEAHGEGLQVLRYGPGTTSTPHFDFLIPSNAASRQSIGRSGQRISSLVVYLNDVASGGETAFPEVGLSICPKKGHAVYFEYCNRRGQVDPRSLHTGAPVAAGEKWAATKWMRQQPFVSA
jgi:prolyl 4-hydroxylase